MDFHEPKISKYIASDLIDLIKGKFLKKPYFSEQVIIDDTDVTSGDKRLKSATFFQAQFFSIIK